MERYAQVCKPKHTSSELYLLSNRCVTQLYYRLFYHLELEGLLDPLSDKHLFVLHYIYLPRIQRSLDQFREGWNYHSIRTEYNQSPYQLFVSGALRLQESGLAALDFFEEVDENYGIEEVGFSSNDSNETVNISPVGFELSEEHYRHLNATVNPLANSDNFGIDIYQQVMQYIDSIVAN